MALARGSAFTRLAAAGVVAVTLLGACAAATTSPSAPVVPIVLRVAPDNLGCDAAGNPWTFFVIRIDAFAADQVWAINDKGGRMNAFWERGFVGGTSTNPIVVDPDGQVVARDGERIDVPDAAWPQLHGHFVCPGLDAIYILLEPPQ